MSAHAPRKRHAYAAPAWAAEQRVGSVGAKAVLLVLANYADENFSCYPGQQTIAYETEQHVNTVARQLKRLEELGLIRREKRYGADGTRTSDRYFLQLDLVVDVHETPDGTGESLPSDSVGRQVGALQPQTDYPPSPLATNHHETPDYPLPECGGTPSSRTPSSRTPSLSRTDPPTASQYGRGGTEPPAVHKPRQRAERTEAAQARWDLADEIARTWWESWKDRNVTIVGDKFPGFRKSIVLAALEAGADPEHVRRALVACAEPFPSLARFQRELAAIQDPTSIQSRPGGRGGSRGPWRDQSVTPEEHARLAAQFDGTGVNETRMK